MRGSDAAAAADNGMVEPQHHRADNGDEQAVEVEAGNAGLAELIEQEAADDRTDDAEQDVDEYAMSGVIDDLTANEAAYCQ